MMIDRADSRLVGLKGRKRNAIVPIEVGRYISSEAVLGDQVLEILTSAMYGSPLSVYREYIQNSADALAGGNGLSQGSIEVSVDARRQSIQIKDNGPGLSEEMAVRALVPIGTSQKRRGIDRGFRGIGRLSGLAFARSVTFLTRMNDSQSVTRVKWNGPELRASIGKTGHTAQSVRECVEVTREAGEGFPGHFFWVNVDDVHRHVAGALLNREVIRSYIAEVCPVPIAASFPFLAHIEQLFADREQPLALTVSLAGDPQPILRPLGKELRLSKQRVDRYRDFEEVRVLSLDRSGVAAVGWIAHSSYMGVLPKSLGIRGMRVRVGNIQIGGEDVFGHLFDQDRFNRWCVGEIHITDARIVPNGRRDYFEANPHLRNLENQLAVLFRSIVARCRSASRMRNRLRRFEVEVDDMERWYQLVSSGWLARDDTVELARKIEKRARQIAEKADTAERRNKQVAARLRSVIDALRDFEGPTQHPLVSMTTIERRAYHHVFRSIVNATDSPRVALRTIRAVAERVGSEKKQDG